MRHGFLAARARGLDHPAHGERLAAAGAHFNGYLVGRAADAPALDLHRRLDVLERRGQHLEGLRAAATGLLGDAIEGTIDDALGGGFLAALHHDVHELREHVALELRVRQDGAAGRSGATRHGSIPRLFLRALGAVLGSALLAIADAGAVERAANRVVAHTRQVLDAAAADEHHGVLLQVVSLATDVAGDFVAVGEAHTRDLAQGRIRLLGRGGVYAGTDPSLLWRSAEGRDLGLLRRHAARLAD